MIDVHTIMPSLVYVFLFLSLPAYILAKSIFSPILNPGSDAAETRDPLTRSGMHILCTVTLLIFFSLDLYQGDILLLGDEVIRRF